MSPGMLFLSQVLKVVAYSGSCLIVYRSVSAVSAVLAVNASSNIRRLLRGIDRVARSCERGG